MAVSSGSVKQEQGVAVLKDRTGSTRFLSLKLDAGGIFLHVASVQDKSGLGSAGRLVRRACDQRKGPRRTCRHVVA